MNLLKNPGCEEGAHQDTRYWVKNDGPHRDRYDNIWPPIGWVAWWIERRINAGSPADQKTGRPEFHTLDCPPFPDPARLHSGTKFAKLHTFFRTHYCGWLQQAPVVAGCTYRFSVYIHSWYSACSTEPHEPPLLDDCSTPARDSHDILQVGIGPGGDDQSPLSSLIVWGAPTEIYGGYNQALSVEATVDVDTVTVWIRSKTNYALKHEDVYFDDAVLELIEEPPPPPREYSRTYVLWPKDATPEEQLRITALHPGVTCGPSADDAAIDHPNLSDATIICYAPQSWPASDEFPAGKAGLEQFWKKYYDFPQAGDSLEYREDDELPPPHPWLLDQRDPAWADLPFGDDDCDSTIGQQGCFITCLAMAQRYYGIATGTNATPHSVDWHLGPQGYNGCVANWRDESALYALALDLSVRFVAKSNSLEAFEHMDKGGCAMAEVEPPELEHFVLVYVNGDEMLALDPWENVERPFNFSDAQSWRLLTHVKPEPPPQDQPARVGLHLQSSVGDWRGFIQKTGGPVKMLNMWSELLQAKRVGAVLPVLRQWVEEQPIGTPDKDALMRGYVDRFRSDMENVCDTLSREGYDEPYFGVEGYNETYACWAASLPDAIECDRSMIRALAGYPVAPVVFCAAVGNPQLPSEDPDGIWPYLLTLARETQAAGGLWGYHGYWFANPSESGLVEHWPYLAGRWALFDDYLTERGVEVGWFSGETGAVGGAYVDDKAEVKSLASEAAMWPVANVYASDWKPHAVFVPGASGYILLPHHGWKSRECYGGNWSRYVTDAVTFGEMTKSWNDTHGNRMWGGTLFTSGPWGWESFQIGPEEMRLLAEALR